MFFFETLQIKSRKLRLKHLCPPSSTSPSTCYGDRIHFGSGEGRPTPSKSAKEVRTPKIKTDPFQQYFTLFLLKFIADMLGVDTYTTPSRFYVDKFKPRPVSRVVPGLQRKEAFAEVLPKQWEGGDITDAEVFNFNFVSSLVTKLSLKHLKK